MYITKAEVAAARRILFARPRDPQRRGLDVAVRPISEAWRGIGKMPAYKTATANVAYIWREHTVDRFGPTPEHFGHDYDLRTAALLLPSSAPKWAAEGFRIWEEADEAVAAMGDPTEVVAWHAMLEIPDAVTPCSWNDLVRSFLQVELVRKGAPVAYAIHALGDAENGWVIKPHAHAIVAARHYAHDSRQGARHPLWLATFGLQTAFAMAWRRHCAMPQMVASAFSRAPAAKAA